MSIRTKAWIARQPYSVRFTHDNIEKDDSPDSLIFIEDNKKLITAGDINSFKRGHFWPSLVLVEKHWKGSNALVYVFIRVYKKKLRLIVDLLMGDSMDIIAELSSNFDHIPIYRIITSKNGKRGSVQKLLDFQE